MYYVSNKIVEKKLKMDQCNYMRVIETLSRDLLMMIHFWKSFGFGLSKDNSSVVENIITLSL